MTGNNTMILNQATIKEALQHYFEDVVFESEQCPTVLNVKTTGDPCGAFKVEVGNKEKEEE